jgi:hypothetical protein
MGLERKRRVEINQGVDEALARENYRQETGRVLQEITEYPSDITRAVDSLNIPIPEMHRIINKLEHVGFLRVPITDRGPNFNDDPETNNAEFRRTQKWAQNYAQFERSGSQAFLVGGIDDLQTNLKNVYIKFPAEYDPDSVVMPVRRERHTRRDEQGDAVKSREQVTYEKRLERYEQDLALIEQLQRDTTYGSLVDDVNALEVLHRAIQDEAWPLYEDRMNELNEQTEEDNEGLGDDEKQPLIASPDKIPAGDKRLIVDPIDARHTTMFAARRLPNGTPVPPNILRIVTLARLKAVGKLNKPIPPMPKRS